MNRAAQALGRLAMGKPKNYSAEEIAVAEAFLGQWPDGPQERNIASSNPKAV